MASVTLAPVIERSLPSRRLQMLDIADDCLTEAPLDLRRFNRLQDLYCINTLMATASFGLLPRSLRVLRAEGCFIPVGPLRGVHLDFTGFSQLERLELGYTRAVTDETIASLAAACAPTLHALQLTACPSVTPVAGPSLAKLKALIALVLPGTRAVTPAVLAMLPPSLQVLDVTVIRGGRGPLDVSHLPYLQWKRLE